MMLEVTHTGLKVFTGCSLETPDLEGLQKDAWHIPGIRFPDPTLPLCSPLSNESSPCLPTTSAVECGS